MSEAEGWEDEVDIVAPIAVGFGIAVAVLVGFYIDDLYSIIQLPVSASTVVWGIVALYGGWATLMVILLESNSSLLEEAQGEA